MTEDEACEFLEKGETLCHFAPGKAAPLQVRLSTNAVVMLFLATLMAAILGLFFVKLVPWLGVLLVAFYFPTIYAIFFRSGSAKTCYAVTNRRVLILPPKGSPKTIAEMTEVSTDTSGAVRVRDGDGKLHCLTPSDADALERAILEMASPARSAVVASPDNLGMESLLLDGEQILWSGKVKAWYLLKSRLRLLYPLALASVMLYQGIYEKLTFWNFLMFFAIVYISLPQDEGFYVITNRRAWWVCGARRRSIPLANAPEVWLRKNGVGTMLFPGKRRWQGVPETEKAAEAIRQALVAPTPQTATTVSVEEPAAWWLSARR